MTCIQNRSLGSYPTIRETERLDAYFKYERENWRAQKMPMSIILALPFSGEMLLGPLPADSARPRKPCLLGHGIHGSRTGFLLRGRNHPHQQRIWLQPAVKWRDITNSQRVASRELGGCGGYKRAKAESPNGQGAVFSLCFLRAGYLDSRSTLSDCILWETCTFCESHSSDGFLEGYEKHLHHGNHSGECSLQCPEDFVVKGRNYEAKRQHRFDLVKATVTDFGTANPISNANPDWTANKAKYESVNAVF